MGGRGHLKDICAGRSCYQLVPGNGAIAFASVFEMIARKGYDGGRSLELYIYVVFISRSPEKVIATDPGSD